MKKLIASAALGLCFGFGVSGPAWAAPITCPAGQVAVINPSVEGGWSCVNNGGNTNLSEDPKNPNAGKGDFQH
jgi:hypothetical protein